MIVMLRLEAIELPPSDNRVKLIRKLGHIDGIIPDPKPWIARLGVVDDTITRDCIAPRVDYSKADRKGQKGIFHEFIFSASPNDCFEVYHKTNPKDSTRYYCRFVEGKPIKISEDVLWQFLRKD